MRQLLTRRPFEAFRITMSSGQVFEVRHPEMAMLTKSRMMVTIVDERGRPSDQVEFLSYLHIAHVQTIQPSESAA